MVNFDVSPMIVQILRHQTPMAMMGAVLAAEQAPVCDNVCRNRPLNLALPHKFKEANLVRPPVSAAFSVFVYYLLRWRKFGKMNIFHAADLGEKVCEIAALGEAGKLGDVIQTNVYDALRAGRAQETKEMVRRLLGKSNSMNFHESFPISWNAGSSFT